MSRYNRQKRHAVWRSAKGLVFSSPAAATRDIATAVCSWRRTGRTTGAAAWPLSKVASAAGREPCTPTRSAGQTASARREDYCSSRSDLVAATTTTSPAHLLNTDKRTNHLCNMLSELNIFKKIKHSILNIESSTCDKQRVNDRLNFSASKKTTYSSRSCYRAI